MAFSAGAVSVDIKTGRNDVKPALQSLTSLAKGVGSKIAVALGGATLAAFSKSCIDAASSAQQTANRLSTVFPEMQGKVDAFASSAMQKMGMTAGQAKSLSASFGMMAEGMGFSEKSAAEMSTTMTRLAGDMAAFYGISVQDAQSKLTGVFTGMTRGMKTLGVNMSEANLQAHALSLGISKDVSDMGDAELASLRLSYAQSQLAKTSGYAQRNMGTWAGQTQLLSQQAGKLRATLGKALVAALLPALNVVNKVMAALVDMANTAVAVIEKLTGQDLGKLLGNAASGAADLADVTEDAAGSSDDLTSAQMDAADAAKKQEKAQKALNKTLAGFDKINRLQSRQKTEKTEKAEKPGKTTGLGLSAQIADASGFADALASVNEQGAKLSDIKLPPALAEAFEKLKKAVEPFVTTVKSGLKWVWDNVLVPLGKWTLDELAPKLVDLLAAAFEVLNEVVDALKPAAKWLWENFLKPLAKWAGEHIIQLLGWLADRLRDIAKWAKEHPRAFKAIVTGLLGLFAARKGFKLFKGVLKWLTGKKTGLGALARFFKKFPGGKGISKAINGVRKSLKGLTAGKLFSKVGSGLKGLGGGFKKLGGRIATSAKHGAKGIGRYVKSFGTFAKTKVGGVAKSVGKSFKSLGSRLGGFGKRLVKTKLGPKLGNIGKMLGKLKGPLKFVLQLITKNPIGIILTAVAAAALLIYKNWDKIKKTKIGQSLQNIADKLKPVGEKLQELGDKILGKIMDAAGKLWEKIEPFLEKAAPVIEDIVGWIADGICGGLDLLGKAIDAVSPVMEDFAKFLSKTFGPVVDAIGGFVQGIADGWAALTGGDKKVELTVDAKEKNPGTLSSLGGKWSSIDDKDATLDGNVKASVANKWPEAKDAFDWSKKGLNGKSGTVIGNVEASINEKTWGKTKNAFEWSKDGLRSRTETVLGKVQGQIQEKLWNKTRKAFDWSKVGLKTKKATVLGNVQAAVQGAWSKSKKAFTWANRKGTLFKNKKKLLQGDIKTNGDGSKFANMKKHWSWANKHLKDRTATATAKFNDAFTEPFKKAWNNMADKANNVYKGINKVFKTNLPGIPKMAQGGFVARNSPMLAVVGDNTHEGEIVSPESKFQTMLDKASSRSGGAEQLLPVLNAILSAVQAVDPNVYIDGNAVTRKVVSNVNRQTRATGRCPILV